MTARPPDGPPHLTGRELHVLHGIAEGKTNLQIGHDNNITEDTVKTHARRIFRKLGAVNRTHVVALALDAGLLELRRTRPDPRVRRIWEVLEACTDERRQAPADSRYARLFDAVAAALNCREDTRHDPAPTHAAAARRLRPGTRRGRRTPCRAHPPAPDHRPGAS